MSNQQYLDLITSQYRDKTKFISWLTHWLDILEDIKNLLESINPAFNIETGEGGILDILGERVGQGRTVNFSFTDGVTSSVLTDELYRIVLKAKIIKNNWKGSIPEIYEMWDALFPETILAIIDNQDMSWDVIYAMEDSLPLDELVSHGYIVPKPEGVRVNYYKATLPIFGFDLDTDMIKGCDEGLWLEAAVPTT